MVTQLIHFLAKAACGKTCTLPDTVDAAATTFEITNYVTVPGSAKVSLPEWFCS